MDCILLQLNYNDKLFNDNTVQQQNSATLAFCLVDFLYLEIVCISYYCKSSNSVNAPH